jgi:hypothetical protein
MQYFPPAWKHANVISTLQPLKDPAQPSCYGPMSDTIGKLLEKIILTRILGEVSGCELLRVEHLGSDQNTALRYS